MNRRVYTFILRFGTVLLWLGAGLWLLGCHQDGQIRSVSESVQEPEQAATSDTPNSKPSTIIQPHDVQPDDDESALLAESPDLDIHQLIHYERYEQPRSIAHVVRIPNPSMVEVQVSLADGLATVEQHIQDAGAIAAINAGFFDPHNQQTTSYVTVGGAIAADPRDNARLINNPDLAPYLEAILNRSEFRTLACGDRPQVTIAYHIAHHTDAPPSNCIIESAVGGGPRLLPSLQSVEEGFVAYGDDGAVIRDAIGSLSPNARSAVGMTAAGEIVLVMVAQRPEVGDRTGMSLPDLAVFLESLGVQEALNLDGGSSSSLYVEGTTHYGRFDAENQPIQRPVKSVIVVRPRVP